MVIDEEVLENTGSTFLGSLEHLVFRHTVIGIEAYVCVLYIRIESSLRLEEDMLLS